MHQGDPASTISLRSAHLDDLDALTAIRSTVEVRRWWRGEDDGSDLVENLDDPEVEVRVIERSGRVVGLIQFAEEVDPEYRHAGIDIFIDPAHHREGIASTAIRCLMRELIDERGHHRLTIDPAADNAAAIACYTSVGFRPVGVMRNYERGADGTWHDGLLMEHVVGVDDVDAADAR